MIEFRNVTKTKWHFYTLLFLFSLLLACLCKDYDYDLYARLIVGEHFFNTGWISYQDFLSYTPTHIWYDHEWGSSVVFYTFLKLFGNFGLILLQALTIFFTTFFIIKTQKLQKHPYPTSLAFIVGFMLLYAHQNPSIVRCHMFSFMFFAMFLYFLEKTRLKGSNILWLVPILTIVWNNLHGGVVAGLGIIFIYMIGAILSQKHWKKYFLVLTVSTPLLIINPYGYNYIEFLFTANTMNRKYITEWWGVFIQKHVFYYYPMFFVGIFTVFLSFLKFLSKKRIDLTKVLALLVVSYQGFIHVKLLSLTLIVVSALFYNDIIHLLNKNTQRQINKIATIVLFTLVLFIPFTRPSIARTDFTKYPVKEVEFLKINKIKGNILTHFALGSYVSYKLYPQNLIYMDGRYEEVYNNKEFNALRDYELINPNWDDILELYPTEILMPEINSNIYKHLKMQKTWEEVYSGDLCGVFLRKNRKTNKKFLYPKNDENYYKAFEFDKLSQFGR